MLVKAIFTLYLTTVIKMYSKCYLKVHNMQLFTISRYFIIKLYTVYKNNKIIFTSYYRDVNKPITTIIKLSK